MNLADAAGTVPLLCPVPADDVDRSDDLNGWLAGLRPGSLVSLAATVGRVYRVDKSLRLTGLEHVGILHAAFTVGGPSVEYGTNGRSQRRHLKLTGCTDVTLDRVTIHGQNVTNEQGAPVTETEWATYDPTREAEHGLQVTDSARILVTRYRCDGVYGDGIYLRGVEDFTARRFKITRNGRQGVAVTDGQRIRLRRGKIWSRRAGVDLEPNNPNDVIRDVEIGNVTNNSRLLALTAGGPGDVSNIHVHHFRNTRSAAPTISLAPTPGGRRDNWLIRDWVSDFTPGSAAPVIRVRDAAGFTLRGFAAAVPANRAMTGVDATNSTVALANVTIVGAATLLANTGSTATITDCNPEV